MFGLSAIVVVAILIVTVLIRVVTTIDDSAADAYRARTDFRALLTLALDQETGLRGYVATDERQFLAPFENATPQFAPLIADARKRLDSQPTTSARTTVLLDAFAQAHARWNGQIAQPLLSNPHRANALALEQRGRLYMDGIRHIEEQAIAIVQTDVDSGARAERTAILLSFAALTIFVLVVAGGAAYIGHLREQRLNEFAAALERRNTEIDSLNQFRSDLIALLAHDIKGPMTRIIGFAQLAHEPGVSSEEQESYLEAIEVAARRAADLATDALSMSDLERNGIHLSPKPVDLVRMVRELAASFRATRPVNVTTNERSITLQADDMRLYQVFENLIANAIKYSPEGQAIDLVIRRSGDRASVTVRDYGIGIPPNELSTLFQRFARASNARKLGIEGTGLGLFLARYIVEQHGGMLTATSALGHGSTFTVELPLSARPSADGIKHPQAAAEPEPLN